MEEQRKKILIVDDSEMNREILVSMLEDEYDLIQAYSYPITAGIIPYSVLT